MGPARSRCKCVARAGVVGRAPRSLGNIAFAFGTAIVLLEVQDTLKEPPAAAVSMKKTLNVS